MLVISKLFDEYITTLDKKEIKVNLLLDDLSKILAIEDKIINLTVADKINVVINEFESCSGHSLVNLMRQYSIKDRLTYKEILQEASISIGLKLAKSRSIIDFEKAICEAFLNDIWERMDEEQKKKLLDEIKEQLPKNMAKEVSKKIAEGSLPLGSILLASSAGFSLYIAATTSLGALSSALGLSLGFGAYTTLTSGISTILGPLGWTISLGFLAYKMGTPNYRTKVIPCILIFSIMRGELEAWNNSSWFKKLFKKI